MGIKSKVNIGKELVENFKKLKESQGISELEKLAETFGLKQETDKALDIKEVTSESYVEKRELKEELKKPLWRRGMKVVVSGTMGLLLGKKLMGKKGKEVVGEALDQGVDVVMTEEKMKGVNDTMFAAMMVKKDMEVAEEEVNKKWKFEPKEKVENWLEDIKAKEEKYENYGTMDAIKEAWENTKMEYDEETGERKKRNVFWRVLAFFPAVISTFKNWKVFEKFKKTGALEKIEQGEHMKEKLEERKKEYEEVEGKINKGLETKKTAFNVIFEENPGALMISKNYLKGLSNLTRNADKYTSAERATQMQKLAYASVKNGTKEFGPGFTKMKGFKKYLPGVSVKTRGGFMMVEIIGSALGKALREGAEGGGISKALGVFWEEVKDTDNWKDACPIWGTIRSGERLAKKDDSPAWSKWTEFGLSLGMDVAMVAGIAASWGTASAHLLAARTAGGSLLRNGIRKGAMKQVTKNTVRAGGKMFTRGVSKTTKKRIVMTAGGKWALRMNLMMATLGEFFGDDVDEIKSEVKAEAIDAMLSDEHKYFFALKKAAESGGLPPTREAFFAEEDKKRKEEIEEDEVLQAAGIFSSDKSAKEGDEEIIVPEKLKKPDEEKSQKSGLKEKIIKKVKEEIVKKVV
jgi:hypothetical protein